MDHVKLVPVVAQIVKGVRLVELERIVLLRFDVHAHDFEASAGVAHRSATGTAKKVEEFWFGISVHFFPRHGNRRGGVMTAPRWTGSNHSREI